MQANDWIVGETAPLTLQILDAADIAIAPSSIRLLVKPPGLPVKIIDALQNDSTGAYRYNLPLDKKGLWYYRWEISAPLPAVAEGSIAVQPSRFVM